jgi:hypothetical protein
MPDQVRHDVVVLFSCRFNQMKLILMSLEMQVFICLPVKEKPDNILAFMIHFNIIPLIIEFWIFIRRMSSRECMFIDLVHVYTERICNMAGLRPLADLALQNQSIMIGLMTSDHVVVIWLKTSPLSCQHYQPFIERKLWEQPQSHSAVYGSPD